MLVFDPTRPWSCLAGHRPDLVGLKSLPPVAEVELPPRSLRL